MQGDTELVRDTETELLFNHSSRVCYFGALTGLRRGLQFDREMEWINELVLPGGDVAASDRAQGSIFFVGNATVILSYAGFTILTDPNFLHRGDHVHLGHGMTAARRTDPALELEALPSIDLVLLSHMHEDHFDREVERRLDHSLPIVTTPHAAADLTSKGQQNYIAVFSIAHWESPCGT